MGDGVQDFGLLNNPATLFATGSMASDVRSIFIQNELQYPPIDPFGIRKEEIRALYSKLCDGGGHVYENAEIQRRPPRLISKREKGHSSIEFPEHAIRIEEGGLEMPVDEFVGIVRDILRALEDRPPIFLLQRCKIQCLTQPEQVSNAIELLAFRASNVFASIDAFNRFPSDFGIRFRFEPTDRIRNDIADRLKESTAEPESEERKELEEMQREASQMEGDGYVTVRMESYVEDSDLVWIEVGSVHILKPTDRESQILEIARNIENTYAFASERCKAFLDAFDTPDTDEGDQP